MSPLDGSPPYSDEELDAAAGKPPYSRDLWLVDFFISELAVKMSLVEGNPPYSLRSVDGELRTNAL